MTAVGGFDHPGIDSRVGHRLEQGLGAEVSGIGIGVLSESGHPDSDNVNISHCSTPGARSGIR